MRTKTITVAGKEIKLKADGAMALLYNSEFDRDYIADVLTIGATLAAIYSEKSDASAYATLNTQVLYNLIYILAKNADDSLPPIIEWYATFDEFPILDVFKEVDDLLMSNMRKTVDKVKKK